MSVEAGPLRRIESDFRGGRNRLLFRRSWLPAAPERVLLLVHGYGEHSGRYEGFASWFAARGSAVQGFDLVGHGRSEGQRGHVARFEDFLDDLDALLAQVRSEQRGLPLYLVGHSMGGLIAAAFAAERAPRIEGLVLSGPALEPVGAPGAFAGAVLGALRRVAPRAGAQRPLEPQALASDPAVGRAYREDPLVHQFITLSLASELLAAAERTRGAGARIELPTLLLHGADDTLCRPAGSLELARGIGSERARVEIYPGLRHEVFNEAERERVYRDLQGWIAAREGGSGGRT